MKVVLHFIATGLVLVMTALPCVAKTLTVAIGDLNDMLSREGELSVLEKQVIEKIQQTIRESGLRLIDGQLQMTVTSPWQVYDNACSVNKSADFTSTIKLNNNSALQIELNGLSKPIIVKLALDGQIDVLSHAAFNFGARLLGDCVEYGSDHFTVHGSGNARINLDVNVNLNPALDDNRESAETIIRMRPQISIGGEILDISAVNIDFDNTDVVRFFEGSIRDKLNAYLAPGALRQEYAGALLNLENTVKTRLAQSVMDEQEFAQWTVDQPIDMNYSIPAMGELLLTDILTAYTKYDVNYSLSKAYLNEHRKEMLYYIILGERKKLIDLLRSTVACGVSKGAMLDLPRYPVPDSVQLESYTYDDFCQTMLNPSVVGNADWWDGENGELFETPWSQTWGTRFDVSPVSLQGNFMPYMKRVKYKAIEGGDKADGTCKLELRVYKKDIAATDLKPLIMFHGGSWQKRTSTFLVLEALISQFTERGFVVFAPFYRLLGDSDGNTACQHADGEAIVEDAEDAFNWVVDNGAELGASGGLYLFGQSAGAYLAGLLALHHNHSVNKSLLMYPPTDLALFVQQVVQGNITDQASVATINLFFGVDNPDAIDDASIALYSLPQLVLAGSKPPPMRMIHGTDDTVVPALHSTRLCAAIRGDLTADLVGDKHGNPLILSCGDGQSQVSLIQGAEHALALCLPGLKCFSASDGVSTHVTAGILVNDWDWLAATNLATASSADASDSNVGNRSVSQGGGALDGWFLWIVVMYLFGNHRQSYCYRVCKYGFRGRRRNSIG